MGLMKKILLLAANPKNTSPLRLDEEFREIDEGLRRARRRDQFEIFSRQAVRTDDLRRALLDYEPQIVHFSGHGFGEQGLVLEDETGQAKLVSVDTLARLFKLFKNQVQCVLLNACYSEVQAEAINQYIDHVIGMQQSIGDRAAIEFAKGFYDALGAGRSFKDAYEFGISALDLEGIPEGLTPIFKQRVHSMPPDPLAAHYKLVINGIKRGQLVPFIGPDINLCDRQAPYSLPKDWDSSGSYPPSNDELAAYLDEEGGGSYNLELECPLCDKAQSGLPTGCPIRTGVVTRLALGQVSQYVDLKAGVGILYDALKNVAEQFYTPNRVHKFLAKLPQFMYEKGYSHSPQLFVTANFDSTLENAFKDANQPFDLVSYIHTETGGGFIHQKFRRESSRDGAIQIAEVGKAHRIERPSEYEEFSLAEYPVILKLYGSSDRNEEDNSENSFVVTEDQYIDYLAQFTIEELLPIKLLKKLRDSNILFLGYSLDYWNQRVILHRIWPKPADRGRQWWAIQANPGIIDDEIWKRNDVDLIDQSPDDYVTKLEERLQDLVHKERRYG